ncbi:phosphoesterase PA-phosphatase-related protein [Halovivax asiaticus JCM 14624]|uniref:Phosphoesterase PA-phosphatase-related protein n=1 Tax=Halovivax asiaticus JCM 14624 TaxID=1227490 RepID=M0BMR2_9EURY|nr:phosphatase PAP2 family protein [Halovivax asiaticus]ELZ10909.1 phosphoesterase PA-phosphatase-related protein [Halovivax asiaticus JCM 14624]
MTRGIGEHALVNELLPDWLAVVFGIFTQLGDIWLLSLLLASLFLLDTPSRSGVAFVGGAWFAGLGLYRGLKDLLAWPRPSAMPLDPNPAGVVELVYEVTAFAGGYGFPSGHATSTTIVYVGLASVLTVSTARRRYTAAGTVVALVCLARIVLGLHYLVDVVAGVTLALTLLFGARALADHRSLDRATVAFAVAIPLAGFYLVTSGAELEAVLILAASLAGLVGWRRYDSTRMA